MTGRKPRRNKVQITVVTSTFCSFFGFGYVNSETLNIRSCDLLIFIASIRRHSHPQTAEKVSFASFFYTQFENLNDVIPSYLSSVSCFEDKTMYIIKNIFQLTKDHLVPKGEL